MATIVIITALIWLFERDKDVKPENNVNDKIQSPIENSIIFGICTILGKAPFPGISTRAGQFLTFGVFILQIIVVAIYTASLFSYLIAENSNSAISGLDDIKNGKIPPNRIGNVIGSAAENFYLKTVSQGKKDYYPLTTVNEIFTSLTNNIIDAAIWGNLSIGYFTNNKYCDLETVGLDFGQSFYQLPVPRGWIFKADLDSAIASSIDSKELQRLSTKWFKTRTCIRTTEFGTKTEISIERMSGLFIFLIIVCIIALFIHFSPTINGFTQAIIRKVRKRLPDRRQNRLPYLVRSSSRIETISASSSEIKR